MNSEPNLPIEAMPATAGSVLSGGGEMGALIRAKDWSATPLGPVELWPAGLISTLSICLTARFPMAIYWGPSGFLLYNDAWRPILGEKHPWALGETAQSVWPEIWSIIDPLFESVRSTGEATWRGDELLPMRRFGYTEECYFDYTFNPIRGRSGEVEGILNVVLETTYRVLNDRRAELLRELASRLVAAKTAHEVCSASMAALTTDPADIPFALLYLVEPNEQVARLAASTGLPRGTPARMEVIDLSSNAIQQSWPLAAAAQSSGPLRVDNITARFGEIIASPWPEPITEAMVLPVAATGHTATAALLVVGISSRRALDDGYQAFLEHVASHFAAALGDARAYEEERKRAEALAELDRAKTTFFSNVSHEFRTPLTLMLGPLEEALAKKREDLSPVVAEDLRIAHRNGLRLLKLVNSLLDFSRIEAGRMKASYEPVELAGFTAELASVFRSAVEKAGLRLVVDCQPLKQAVHVDRSMWEKIVLNLLSNAFKFTLEGEITVSLKVVGETAALSVKDTGIGIPADEVPRLFERFHRVEGSQGRTHEGTGIGLALVHELVKLHGGSVTIVSEINQGSTFTVTLPLGSDHLAPEHVQSAPKDHSTPQSTNFYTEEALRWLPSTESELNQQINDNSPTESPEGDAQISATRGARIILADDNADMRGYVQRLLQPYWKVEAVADGQAALDAALREKPDLVLTDVMMPRLDGFGLLRALRERKSLQSVPILLLSARAGEEARIEGMESGADDYLVKPFSARELLARVSAHLQMARIRQEAHESVRESQERVRLATEAAGLGVWVWEPGTDRVTWENDRAYEVFGLSRSAEPINSANFRNRVVHPDDLPLFDQAVAATLETGSPFFFQGRIRHPSGETRWVEFTGRQQFARDGVSLRVLGTVADITERKQTAEAVQRAAEEALTAAQTNAKFHTFFDQGTYFAGVMGLDGTLLEANRLSLDACGFAKDEVIGKKFWECGWWNRSPELVEKIHAACLQAAAGKAFREETNYFIADGSQRFVDLVIAPVTDETGKVLFVAPTGTDITERKRLTDERESLLQAERSARSEAERVGRMKDEFLATLSHELRTPLNAILGWTYLLQSPERTNEDIQEGVEVIERNTRVQAQLIEDLLDMSRIISGKVRLDVQQVDIQDVVKAAVESVQHSANAKDIRLQVMLDPLAGPVRGDPSRLQQCFWNLLSNAIKFTPRNGRIQVALERVNSHIEISVTDTGQGIKPEFLPHVFERFRQADASTTRRFGGLGLGLSIVKQLAELHGGAVRAKSAGEGKGATFIIDLPLLVIRAAEPAPSREHPRASSRESFVGDHPSLKGVTVLAVDDEPDARTLLKRVLEDCGAQVLLAASAQEGLAVLKSKRPDMILSDIGMPDVDGYEFMRWVRRLAPEEGGKTPAAALTAFARAEDRTRALRAGFQTHVSKPVEPSELTAVVASLTGRSDR